MPLDPEDELLTGYVDVYHAAAVLRGISAYARLEHQVDELIWKLAEIEPEIGACLTAQIVSIAPRMDALITLAYAQHVSEECLTRLNKFKARIGGLSNERNRLAHDPWFSGFQTDKLFRLEKTARGKLIHRFQPVTEEELGEYERKVESAHADFSQLSSEILGSFYSGPRRDPRQE